jgi:hypothetical protein
MKNQRKAWLAAGLLALVVAACFDDPTSGLQSGPVAITTSFNNVSVAAGDSIAVQGTVVDAQGNPIAVGTVSWASADPSVAVANVDAARPAPGDIFTRAFVRGVSNGAGVTTVTVTAQGITATVRVTVLPKTFPGTVAVTGAAGADTILVNRPAPLPVLVLTFSAGDTLVLTATPTVTFNAASSTVSFGTIAGVILSRTASVIKVLARAPYAGAVTITNLTYAGDATTGPIAIASLKTDSVAVQHARFRGTATVGADPNFGVGSLLTVTAQAGMTFDATTGLGLGGTPAVGTTAAIPPTGLIVLSRTATVLTAISPAGLVGVNVLVTKSLLGTVRLDSVRAGTAGTPVTILKSAFPGTVTNQTGHLLDTITVLGGAVATFTTVAATASQVTVGGVGAFILTRSATTITAIAKVGSAGALSISNVIIAGTTIPSLSTATPVNVSTAVTGEVNEPGNQSSATATVMGAGSLNVAGDSLVVYGALDGALDQRDYYQFTMNVAGTVSVRMDFFGDGSGPPSNDLNPDFDVVVCTTLSGTAACSYGQDIIPGNAGSNVLNPETGTTTAIAAGTTVFVRNFSYYLTAAGIGVYRLRVKTP